MKGVRFLFPILALVILQLACGSSSTATKVGEVEAKNKPAQGESNNQQGNQPAAPSKMTIYKIGDILQVHDHTILMNEAALTGTGILRLNFTIDNLGTDEINVSSSLSFTAKKQDGSKLEEEIFDCGTSHLGGKVLAGDKLRGNVCFTGVAPGDVIRIYYESELFDSGATVWEIDTNKDLGIAAKSAEDKKAEKEPAGQEASTNSHAIGEVVSLQDHTIVLNKADITGQTLKANFTVKNNGTKDVALSSIMSFYVKDGSGSKLEQGLFDCSSSMIDGSVIPGDKVTGDICWKVGSDKALKIYYEPSFLGSGAVVWSVPGQ